MSSTDNDTTLPSTPTPSPPATVPVWDIGVRLFHWGLVVAFIVAYISSEEWMNLHVWAGYLITTLLLFRLVWGVVGSHHARFTDFVYAPATVLRYSKDVLRGQAQRYLGHNPAGGAMVVVLLITLFTIITSGLALYGADAWAGPLAPFLKGMDHDSIEILEEVHEIAVNVCLGLIAFHIGGVIWESLLHREDLIRAMLHGRKRPE